MNRRSLLSVLLGSVLAMPFAGPVAAQEAWPARPIQIVVPWAAGGATDAVMRIVATEVSNALEVPVSVVNQTGASGTVGTNAVLQAPRDGYTWASGGVQDLGTYKVQGLLDTTLDDWELFLVVRNAPVLSVSPNSPFQNPQELAAFMKEKPGELTVGTSGIPSTAYSAMQAFQALVGGEFRAVAYDGDAPTMVALVSGEVMASTQSGPGQAAMIKGERVRPLAVLADTPLEITGAKTIPAITDFFPDFNSPGVTIQAGIFVPADAPKEVLDRMGELWANEIANSERLKTYASENGSIFTPVHGDEAKAMARAAVAEAAWRMFDGGTASVSPEEVGIPRP
ncbi:Tripartite-type tricarboxylate transporter, receptor component TctC [Rhizobium sp. RU33A]|uniref:Bug family tripartite tricarboxylate transporter substrate binding protein n=1 Tax=Rhizobium sp. RU33A TaxID=1907413 RepID=UPI000953B4E1|nr:tripartite tricarboxylate transporter substrate binding protein [Rhizobium sp. RU33A]SIR00299.1 Tripartite-type tricarboxylate transporter, receptor component TctC [Rhizobium sp. RU33A]